jgi:hypothetical protein
MDDGSSVIHKSLLMDGKQFGSSDPDDDLYSAGLDDCIGCLEREFLGLVCVLQDHLVCQVCECVELGGGNLVVALVDFQCKSRHGLDAADDLHHCM